MVGFGTGVLVGFFVGFGAGFFVAVGVAGEGTVAEAAGIDVKVGAAVGGGVSVGTGVLVGVGVGVGVSVGVGVAEGVRVAGAVKVKVGLGVRVSVAVARASCWGIILESVQAPISQMARIEPSMIRRVLTVFPDPRGQRKARAKGFSAL